MNFDDGGCCDDGHEGLSDYEDGWRTVVTPEQLAAAKRFVSRRTQRVDDFYQGVVDHDEATRRQQQ